MEGHLYLQKCDQSRTWISTGKGAGAHLSDWAYKNRACQYINLQISWLFADKLWPWNFPLLLNIQWGILYYSYRTKIFTTKKMSCYVTGCSLCPHALFSQARIYMYDLFFLLLFIFWIHTHYKICNNHLFVFFVWWTNTYSIKDRMVEVGHINWDTYM